MKRNSWIWKLTADFFLALAAVGIFLLFFYVLPKKEEGVGTLVADLTVEGESFELPQEETGAGEERTDRKARPEGEKRKQGERTNRGNRQSPGNGNTNTKEIAADDKGEKLESLSENTKVLESYRDDRLQLTLTETQLGEGTERITYYAADIYLTSATQLQTAFAEGSYGKNIRESTLEMAEENQALLAISGDSYGNSESGVVVRNGILYRSDTNDGEICVLYYDGTMAVYTAEEFDREQVLEKEVWQVWNFGPSLLENGEVKESFQTTSYLNGTNPRCAIGYVAPGHYKFVIVDGRAEGYSKGATMSELAQIMKEEGCQLAYNLDGGKSSAMVYNGSYVNQPAGGGREISDMIYIR